MNKIIAGLLLSCATVFAQAAVKGEEVTYKAGDQTFKGYLAYDDAKKDKRPGVLVVHEWWGHNEYARKRARMLAELGYTALALDMYGDGKQAHHPDEAGKFASTVRGNLELATQRFNAAKDLLSKNATVDSKHIAAIGYCFGGSVVLEMARHSAPLDGVVSFHGSLGGLNPVEKGAVKAKVLVANGADDPFVKAEDIEKFKKDMTDAGADFQFINYPGAKHSFTNPDADDYAKKFNMPFAYNKDADEKSWAEMQTFFNKIFK